MCGKGMLLLLPQVKGRDPRMVLGGRSHLCTVDAAEGAPGGARDVHQMS